MAAIDTIGSTVLILAVWRVTRQRPRAISYLTLAGAAAMIA